MARIGVFPTSGDRRVAAEPYVPLHNRYVEQNPTLNDSPLSFISRPGMTKFAEIGGGHIRKLFSTPGIFTNDLFVISAEFLYRLDNMGASTFIGQIGTDLTGDVYMCSTAPIGDTIPAYLFIADGGILWVYTDNGHAIGHLTASGAIANNDVVVIAGVYYKWTNASVDAGTPAGTAGNPWLVALGANNTEAIDNLALAIDELGTAGTTYSTALTGNPNVRSFNWTANDLYVAAIDAGAAGNAFATTETGANLAWSSATLTGGGDPSLRQIRTPGDLGAISVATINSYVIVVPVQSETEGSMGKFFWIKPGETTIDPLDFATAERAPDGIHQVVVFGDMFWLLGTKTTEPWIVVGEETNAVQRFQGILYDRGSWPGTAVQVKDSLIVVDEDGAVFQLGSGSMKRISRPDIEERIRNAIQIP